MLFHHLLHYNIHSARTSSVFCIVVAIATQKKEYKPLQVPANFCSACADGEACVCDTNLFNTYHCEKGKGR